MRRSAATARWVLPVPGSPISSRPGYGPEREFVGVALHVAHHALEFLFSLGLEIFKRSVAIERRDLGAFLQPFGAALGKAGAAFGAGDTGAFDDDPAGAAALLANGLRGHYSYYRADARRGRMGFAGGGPMARPAQNGPLGRGPDYSQYTPAPRGGEYWRVLRLVDGCGGQRVCAVAGVVAERLDNQVVSAGSEAACDARVGIAAAVVVFVDHGALGIEQYQIGVELARVEPQIDGCVGTSDSSDRDRRRCCRCIGIRCR